MKLTSSMCCRARRAPRSDRWKRILVGAVGAAALAGACAPEDEDREAPDTESYAADTNPPQELNGCSDKCPETDVEYDTLDEIPECDSTLHTEDITRCAVALACYLGRSPTKLEFLEALGELSESGGILATTRCLAATLSTQQIPDPEFGADG